MTALCRNVRWPPNPYPVLDSFVSSCVQGIMLVRLRHLALALLLLGILPVDAHGQAKPTWKWDEKLANRYSDKPLRAKVRHTLYSLRELRPKRQGRSSQAELRKELSKGGVKSLVWRTTIKDREWGRLAGAAMLVTADQIFVARHSRIAAGCRLHAFSTKDGALQWSVALEGIGPISHSKWRNDVQLSLHEGNPVVFGREGQRYIEVRDAKTGSLLSNQKLGWRP